MMDSTAEEMYNINIGDEITCKIAELVNLGEMHNINIGDGIVCKL